MDDPIERGLQQGIDEFNTGRFFEAHDTLENVWMDVRGRERLFFQGLIQLAIAYYHLTCENYVGAEHLLTRGIPKLESFQPVCRGVHLGALIASASKTLADVKDYQMSGALPERWELPKIDRSSSNGDNGPADTESR